MITYRELDGDADNPMASETDRFDKTFFEGGAERGSYHDYEFSKLREPFEMAAKWTKDRFNPKKVLDVGCAKGFLVYALREIGIASFGVDVSQPVRNRTLSAQNKILSECLGSREPEASF